MKKMLITTVALLAFVAHANAGGVTGERTETRTRKAKAEKTVGTDVGAQSDAAVTAQADQAEIQSIGVSPAEASDAAAESKVDADYGIALRKIVADHVRHVGTVLDSAIVHAIAVEGQVRSKASSTERALMSMGSKIAPTASIARKKAIGLLMTARMSAKAIALQGKIVAASLGESDSVLKSGGTEKQAEQTLVDGINKRTGHKLTVEEFDGCKGAL